MHRPSEAATTDGWDVLADSIVFFTASSLLFSVEVSNGTLPQSEPALDSGLTVTVLGLPRTEMAPATRVCDS